MDELRRLGETWNHFQQTEFAAEVLIACGALLTLLAIIQIVRKGLSLALWVVLAGLGVLSVSYGMTGSGLSLPGVQQPSLSELVGPGKTISVDVLKTLCGKLSDTPEGNN